MTRRQQSSKPISDLYSSKKIANIYLCVTVNIDLYKTSPSMFYVAVVVVVIVEVIRDV